MDQALQKLIEFGTDAGIRLVGALLLWIIGGIVIKKLTNALTKAKAFEKMDPTVRSFLRNFLKAALYCVLVVCIVSLLGVPMASLVAVLASAGIAVGLALQGSLANFAGGIMLLIFKPFKVGDYIIAGGDEGFVEEVSMFYTILKTWQNVKISVPNGSLMNASVYNTSSEATRRIDLTYNVANGNDPIRVREVMKSAVEATDRILADPEPFFDVVAPTSGGLTYEVRVWCNTEDYWDVYSELSENVTTKLAEAGIAGPMAKNRVFVSNEN